MTEVEKEIKNYIESIQDVWMFAIPSKLNLKKWATMIEMHLNKVMQIQTEIELKPDNRNGLIGTVQNKIDLTYANPYGLIYTKRNKPDLNSDLGLKV